MDYQVLSPAMQLDVLEGVIRVGLHSAFRTVLLAFGLVGALCVLEALTRVVSMRVGGLAHGGAFARPATASVGCMGPAAPCTRHRAG